MSDWPTMYVGVVCENDCCWIVNTHPGEERVAGTRRCFYCDIDREPRDCGEPCRYCGGPEE